MNQKGFSGVLVPCVLFALCAVPAVSGPLTLDQAVQEALTKGADQALWAANLTASRSAEAVARANAGLTVTSTLGYSAAETWSDPSKASDSTVPHTGTAGLTVATPLTNVTVGAARTVTVGPSATTVLPDEGTLNLRQVLWNGYPGGPLQASAEKAALALKVAEWNAQANRNKLVVSVKQAYFTLLSAQEALNQLVQAQKQRAEAARFAQTKFDLGQATVLDLKQAKINARTAELDLDAGRSALETARRRLANLTGRSEDDLTAAVEPGPQVAAGTVDQAVETALKQRIEPLIAQANARSAQVDLDSAWGASTPSVTLTGGLKVTRDLAKNTGALTGTVGVSVGAPLVDAGLSAARQAQAEAQKTAAQIQYQQLVKSIPVDVAEAWNTWQVNVGRLEVAGLALEVAQGQRLVVQTQYEAGLKTLSDLQTSDIALSASQLALLKAKITAQLSALTLQSLMGQ